MRHKTLQDPYTFFGHNRTEQLGDVSYKANSVKKLKKALPWKPFRPFRAWGPFSSPKSG